MTASKFGAEYARSDEMAEFASQTGAFRFPTRVPAAALPAISRSARSRQDHARGTARGMADLRRS